MDFFTAIIYALAHASSKAFFWGVLCTLVLISSIYGIVRSYKALSAGKKARQEQLLQIKRNKAIKEKL